MDMTFDLTFVLVLLFAAAMVALIKSGVGVGSGLFFIPVLSLVVPPKEAVALGAPIMLLTDLFGIRHYWGEWGNLKSAMRLILSGMVGALLATWLMPRIPTAMFQLLIGLYGLLYAICFHCNISIFGRALRAMFPLRPGKTDMSVYAYGTLGGVASVFAHSGGTVWSMYMLHAESNKRVLVSTLFFMFLISDGYKTLAFLSLGLVSTQQLLTCLLAVPGIWLGSAIGNACNKRMSNRFFKNTILAVIAVMSCNLLYSLVRGV